MTDKNIFVRLADVQDALGVASSSTLESVEKFTLTDGYQINEAGISELCDEHGMTLYHDGSRLKH